MWHSRWNARFVLQGRTVFSSSLCYEGHWVAREPVTIFQPNLPHRTAVSKIWAHHVHFLRNQVINKCLKRGFQHYNKIVFHHGFLYGEVACKHPTKWKTTVVVWNKPAVMLIVEQVQIHNMNFSQQIQQFKKKKTFQFSTLYILSLAQHSNGKITKWIY